MLEPVKLYHEVTQWLFYEAELLDAGRYREWLTLLTEDIRYLVPVRVTRGESSLTGFQGHAAHFDENYFTLEKRVARLETGHAWAEQPASRTRHMITNVRLAPTESATDIELRASLLLHRTRGDAPGAETLIGERHDFLRRTDGQLKLSRRTVFLDHSTLPVQNMAILL